MTCTSDGGDGAPLWQMVSMDYAAAVRSKKYSQQHGLTLKMRYRMKKMKRVRSASNIIPVN